MQRLLQTSLAVCLAIHLGHPCFPPAPDAVQKRWPDMEGLAEPVGSFCGHSQYYYSFNSPGIGIVGGSEVQQNFYPWIVRLNLFYDGNNHLCAGSIVDTQVVVTAAHCLKPYADSASGDKAITVYLADHNSSQTDLSESTRTPDAYHIHPDFDETTYDNDIAVLLFTTYKIGFSSWHVQKICLPIDCQHSCQNEEKAYTAGWGVEESGSNTPSEVLRHALVPVIDSATCNVSLVDQISDNMICAGYVHDGGIDSCTGDSGGPLMVASDGYFELCGVTSWGDGCAAVGKPGVYTKVCNYYSWIAGYM